LPRRSAVIENGRVSASHRSRRIAATALVVVLGAVNLINGLAPNAKPALPTR
jgi:hypothetical protein